MIQNAITMIKLDVLQATFLLVVIQKHCQYHRPTNHEHDQEKIDQTTQCLWQYGLVSCSTGVHDLLVIAYHDIHQIVVQRTLAILESRAYLYVDLSLHLCACQ